MKNTMFVLAALTLTLAACGPKKTPFPVEAATQTQAPPTAIPTVTPTPRPTLIPWPQKLEMAYKDCSYQDVYVPSEPLLMVHDFSFGDKSFTKWLTGHGVEKITIDGEVIRLADPSLWSTITERYTDLGTFYDVQFSWMLPALEEGLHRMDAEFSIPDLYGNDGALFKYCSIINILPW